MGVPPFNWKGGFVTVTDGFKVPVDVIYGKARNARPAKFASVDIGLKNRARVTDDLT
jgi:hypothetical protein